MSSNIEPKEKDDTNSPLIVQWDGVDDQENVRTMSKTRKWVIVMLMTCTTLQLTAVNSVWSTVNDVIRKDMNCSEEVALLGLAAFVLALALGPLVVAPLSEYYGKRPVYVVSFVGYTCFHFPTAFGKNIETLVIGRFLTAFFGSALLSNAPSTVSDILYTDELQVPMNLCGLASLGGSGFGPLIGGFMQITIGWRWVFVLFGAWAGVMGVLVFVIVPETYEPILKAKKAKRLREATGLPFYSEYDHGRQHVTIWEAMRENCQRPIMLLIKEPMLLLLCFYAGFFMAIIYLFMIAFPMVFKTVYGFKIQFVGLTFIGNALGMVTAVILSPIFERKRQRDIQKTSYGEPTPEMRMPQACVGGLIAPVGLFMFAWTVYPSIHWMAPIVASYIFGIGCNWVMSAILSYIVESYPLYSASATAANIFLRCSMSTIFPLVGQQMMRGMGYHWAMSLVGFIAIALVPSAFMFAKYGHVLRAKSRFANG